MILKSLIAVFILLTTVPLDSFSQQIKTDTITINLRPEGYKDPKKATILSAIVPGAGQIYNGKAWKVPILYGGFATNIYFIDFNDRRYKALKQALFQLDRQEPNDFPNLNRDGLVRQVNFWRRNRDLNYFLFIGIYALNIIDAQVDAHLSSFDVSDDLSFRFEPSFETLTAGGSIFGLSMKINF
ncbi:DUF5683 domain-containing protein [Cecembia rubra]|uniref:DUF5683 domain-containing protein n=1 Tax=Cecembia rubra TaxID=1485585 RepID=A0A2P8EEP4_9BACT|nr:DUF5683 domain-containing protein [Cecembia rubra]PSL07931.1 hypothetical protein CLV48_101871 [Cecembia rubra]